jgi:hypothetical protein
MHHALNGRGPLRKGHGREHNKQLRGDERNTVLQQLEVGDIRDGLSSIARIGDISDRLSPILVGSAR